MPDITGKGILILPSTFDYSGLSVASAIKLQSLFEENRIIEVSDLHSPAIIQ